MMILWWRNKIATNPKSLSMRPILKTRYPRRSSIQANLRKRLQRRPGQRLTSCQNKQKRTRRQVKATRNFRKTWRSPRVQLGRLLMPCKPKLLRMQHRLVVMKRKQRQTLPKSKKMRQLFLLLNGFLDCT
ncbi:unnamed protein product [Cladocopium goreaui]|uniref:Uncharacterized protein n=1 Tax=Cladocopium goreaui TaxID=2562237 RepID=A0A9P1BX17_9DINO|nr:unnamed protein product [Cladocopium goreaui]